jgi:hypothetical protein
VHESNDSAAKPKNFIINPADFGQKPANLSINLAVMRENLPVHPSVHADLKTLPALVSSDSVVPIFCRWLYRHLRTLCVAR